MANKKKLNTISNKVFSSSDQINFAKFSGDYNPIHMDPIFSRRTIVGQCVVHGMHGLMWALDWFISSFGLKPSSIDVKFLKPIFLDEEVTCFWDCENNRLKIFNELLVLTEARLTFETKVEAFPFNLRSKPALSAPLERSSSEVKNMETQDFFFRGDSQLASEMFSHVSSSYGREVCCEIAAISEVVGMHVPGLHSMLLSAHIRFLQNRFLPSFSLHHINEKFNVLKIAVTGSSLTSEVNAIMRPAPAAGHSLAVLKTKVKDKEFKNVRALIIGGTRGLGECVAKLIALGGGETVITYAFGHDDALNIAKNISEFGEKCSITKLKVPDDLISLTELQGFNQVYYFATPKIFGKRDFAYDESLYLSFHEIYVHSFKKIVEYFMNSTRRIAVYYPSSVAIDTPIKGLAEYIDSKIEGEELCEKITGIGNIHIYVNRLPRAKTDQTLSLTNTEEVDADKVMLPVIREMMKLI